MRTQHVRYLAVVMAFFSFQSILIATDIPDSKGRDFYFAFPPNFHTTPLFGTNEDSLFILIAATEPTQVSVRYTTASGRAFTRQAQITNVRTMYTLALPWQDIELAGYNNGQQIVWQSQNGKVAPQSFHITSEKDITVYALSQANTTSDAMMVLPTDVLGTEYVVLSYNSDGYVGGSSGTGITAESTPSQMAIVATRDATHIAITPSTAVLGGTKAPQTVVLNAGESYLLQADITGNNLRSDLTGTRIVADNPIAVFASHQRSKIPVASSTLESRDYLLEQLPSVDVWGTKYLLTPLPLPVSVPKTSSDIYRVLAAYDNTDVFINDVRRATLQAGEHFESPLTAAATVRATNKVLVAQYKRSASTGSSSSLALSDPFMLIVPPMKQYLKSYLCANTQAYEQGRTIYKEQYITILCPTYFLSTVQIDGNPVNTAQFREIGNSCYSYASFPTTDGPHRIEAATEIGIYVYGYGAANSYGYVGGMGFRKDETSKVAFSVTPNNVSASANDILRLRFHATSATWQDVALTSMTLRLTYNGEWMKYTGDAIRGLALDPTWTVQAREEKGATSTERVLVITAAGSNPIAASGTVATVGMRLLLNREFQYQPTLSAEINNSNFCIETSTQSVSIAIDMCAKNLRPVKFSGQPYSFATRGNQGSAGQLYIQYGVGLAAPVRVELYNRLGELAATFARDTQQPGMYDDVLDVSRIGAGVYFARFTSGPYTETVPVVLGME